MGIIDLFAVILVLHINISSPAKVSAYFFFIDLQRLSRDTLNSQTSFSCYYEYSENSNPGSLSIKVETLGMTLFYSV